MCFSGNWHVQVPSAAIRGPTQAAAVGIQPPVPAAAISRRVDLRAIRQCSTQVQANIYQSVSQAEPEETPVEPPPIQSQDLPLSPAVLERIKGYGSIFISRASPPSPIFKRLLNRSL